jgi:hypothetical protein
MVQFTADDALTRNIIFFWNNYIWHI